jgi:hypothetical protein
MEIIEGLMPRPEHAASVITLLHFLTVALCPKRTPTKVLYAADALTISLLSVPIRVVISRSLKLSQKIQGVLWKRRETLFKPVVERKKLSFRDQRSALMQLCHRYADMSDTLDRVNAVRKTLRKWMSQLPITLSNLTNLQEEDLQWDNMGWTQSLAHASFASFTVVLQSMVSADPTPETHHQIEEDKVPSSPLEISNLYSPRKGHIDATVLKSYCECLLHLATASSRASSSSSWFSTQPSAKLLKEKSHLSKYRGTIHDAVACTFFLVLFLLFFLLFEEG